MRLCAIGTTLALLIARTLGAQSAVPEAVAADTATPYRNATTAAVLGTLFPGAGHLYAGEYAHGLGYYAGTVGGIGGGVLALAFPGLDADKGRAWPLQLSGVVLIAFGAGVWVYSAIDAPRAATRANAKHANKGRLSLVLRERISGPSGANMGLAVAW